MALACRWRAIEQTEGGLVPSADTRDIIIWWFQAKNGLYPHLKADVCGGWVEDEGGDLPVEESNEIKVPRVQSGFRSRVCRIDPMPCSNDAQAGEQEERSTPHMAGTRLGLDTHEGGHRVAMLVVAEVRRQLR